MLLIDRALEKGFSLLVFQERYGGGWTALIGSDADMLALVENQLTCGDTAAVAMQSHLASAGKYFPVSRNQHSTPTKALADLQSVLEAVPEEKWTDWHTKVLDAYDTMQMAYGKRRNSEYWVTEARKVGEITLVD